MCRNIKTLYNFAPPATKDEVRASALQFVRKVSGFHSPSKVNEQAFNRAVEKVTATALELLDSLVTKSPPRGLCWPALTSTWFTGITRMSCNRCRRSTANG